MSFLFWRAHPQVWDMGGVLAELAAAADERASRGRPLPLRPSHAHGHARVRNPTPHSAP